MRYGLTGAAMALAALCACGRDAGTSGALAAEVDPWSGRERRRARVNSVCAEPGAELIRLRGEWDFVTKDIPYRTCYAPYTNASFWAKSRKINVPGCWEAQGVGDAGTSQPWQCFWDCSRRPLRNAYFGCGWYRRRVRIPEDWAGGRVWLKAGAINSAGWLFVNARPAGSVYSYCGTYKFDVTDLVRPGEEAEILVQANNKMPSKRGGLGSCNRWGGILRDIELEATPATYIDDAWVRGDFDARAAEVHVEVAGDAANGAVVRVAVEGKSAEAPAVAGAEAVLKVPLGDFRPWSPESPNLYVADISLVVGGRTVQTWRERFGVRKFEVRGREFFLNGKPFFVRGCGWHAGAPVDGTRLPDRESILRDIAKVKSAGFNYARFHTRCEAPEFFEAADEAGFMLEPELPYYQDFPCDFPVLDPLGDAKELFEHFRRHVSFSVYSGGNEGCFGDILARRLYSEIKSRDPDRLVIDQDGGTLHVDGAYDFVTGPYTSWAPGTFNPTAPFIAHEYMNLCVKADPRVCELFTGVWLPDGMWEKRLAFLKANGLSVEAGDRLQYAQNSLQRFWQKEGIESARRDPYCDGYSFWSLLDVMSPQKGAFTGPSLFDCFLREKKGGSKASDFAVFNSPSCLLLDVSGGPGRFDSDPRPFVRYHRAFDAYFDQTNRILVAGERIPAKFMLAHYGDAALDAGELKWRIVESSGGKVLASGAEFVGRQDIGAVRTIAEPALRAPEVRKAVAARLEAEFGGVANSWNFWFFPKRQPMSGEDLAADPMLLGFMKERYPGIASAQSAEGARRRIVLAPAGSWTARAAAERGVSVVTFENQTGLDNVYLGWWWMGSQMGSVLNDHPALALLPHSGVFDQLLFRIGREGTPLPVAGVEERNLVMFGEGGEHCYAYLAERIQKDGTRGFMVSGLDLLSDTPEGTAILDGILAWLRGR